MAKHRTTRAKWVIGQYGCRCAYGPVLRSERLTYCSVHGDDIQDEYRVSAPKKRKKDKK